MDRAVSRARKGRAVFVHFLRNAAGPVGRGFERRFFRPLSPEGEEGAARCARKGRAVFVHFLRNAAGPVGRGFERWFFRSLSPEGGEGAARCARKGRAVFVHFLRNAAGPVGRGFERRFFRPLSPEGEKAQQDAHARGGRRERRSKRECKGPDARAKIDRPCARDGKRRLRARLFRAGAGDASVAGQGAPRLSSDALRRAGRRGERAAPRCRRVARGARRGICLFRRGRFASAVGEGEFVRARRRCSTPARKTAGSNPEIVCAQGRCPFARLRQGDAAPVRAIKTSHLRARGGKKTPRDGADV